MSWHVVDGCEELEVAVAAEPPKKPSFAHAKESAQGPFNLHLLLGDVVSVDCCGALVWRQKRAEHFDKGCFSCAVGSQKPEEFALFYGKVEAVDGVDGDSLTFEGVGTWGFAFECFCQVDCLDGILVLQP